MVTTATGIATSYIQFTRASNATVTNNVGNIAWAGHNLLLNSESFDASSWSKQQLTVTANSIAAPNGTTTADTIVEDTTTNWHYINRSITFAAGITYTASAFLKAGTQTYGTINIYNSSGGSLYAAASFNLSTGAVANSGVAGTGYSIVGSPSITPIGSSGWYLCSLTFVAGTTAPEYFTISTSDNGVLGSFGMTSYLGASKTIYAWGASLYRSDLGGMVYNPAQPAGFGTYYPTTPKNALGYTEDFSNAAWSKGATTVTADTSISPFGLQTADTLTETSASSGHTVSISATVSTGTYTFSAYLKKGSGATAPNWMQLYVGGSSVSYANFNLATGAYGSVYAGSTASITPVGSSGWYRCSVTFPSSSGSAALVIAFTNNTDTTTRGLSYAGATTSDVLVWGAQLSDSASIDPYSPVYGAAVTSSAYYAPRLDYSPTTIQPLGMLVEEQRTNSIRYSRTLETTGSYWGGLSSGAANTITIDNAPGPDGLSTSASMITYNTAVTGLGTYSIWRNTNTTTANGTYTFSVWLKAGTTSSVYLRFGDSAGNRANTLCTLTSSWQRFTVTGTTAASITTISCDVGADGNAGGQTMTAGTVYAYGAQLEANAPFATSYIPTGASTVTRSADNASVSTQAFPYGATEGTLVANCSFNTGVDIGSYFVQLGGPVAGTSYGSSNSIFRGLNQGLVAGQKFIGLTYDDTNNPTGYVITASDVNVSPSKVSYGFAANNFGASVNGATVITDNTGAMPTAATVLTLGAIRGGLGSFLNGHIRQITYLPRRIPNAELQTRTT